MVKVNASLKSLNTFGLDVKAQRVIVAYTEAELVNLWRQAAAAEGATPPLVLGGGSNVLFLEDYAGTVLLNRIAGISIGEDVDAWHLHVGAGEVWHDLVNFCLEKDICGLENLALIPGCVGSAPIQNIGAYGVELAKVCEYVDMVQLDTGVKRRLSAPECQFGYRDSIFKHEFRERHAIVAVGFQLTKAWRPMLNYGDLSHLDAELVTPRQIYDIVCTMRRNKLPDPKLIGNAGSFFKNPTIDAVAAEKLIRRYPEVPHYPQSNGMVKLAAGWFIDRCGLKGYRLGGARVYDKQALVLISSNGATGRDIAALASYVRRQVAERFGIWLDPEVSFIGASGEVDAVEVIA